MKVSITYKSYRGEKFNETYSLIQAIQKQSSGGGYNSDGSLETMERRIDFLELMIVQLIQEMSVKDIKRFVENNIAESHPEHIINIE